MPSDIVYTLLTRNIFTFLFPEIYFKSVIVNKTLNTFQMDVIPRINEYVNTLMLCGIVTVMA